MIPNYKCIVTGSGTITGGEIRIWDDLDDQDEGMGCCLSRDEKVKGVYAVAISPTGKYLASGSKSGLVRVWAFLNQDLTETAPILFEIYHQQGPVTALAFLTDDLLLSAGDNGKIRVISISKGKYLEDLDAHTGAICSMVALGSKVVASLGIDGQIKIWDMDSVACVFQKDGLLFPHNSLSIYPSMVFSPETGLLYCPSADGKLHFFDMHNSCSHESIQAHQGAFYAMSVCGNHLVTGGVHDRMLKLWSPSEKRLQEEAEINTSVLRICSIGSGKVAAICSDLNKTQSLRLFSLPRLKPIGSIAGLNLRSIATMPSTVVEHFKNIELSHWKDNLIEQARSSIMSPEKIEPFLKQLVDKGFWADAKLLQAESAKQRNKPLHELEILLQLTDAITISLETAPIFRRLALLLEQLNEPELAIRYYKKISSFIDQNEMRHQKLKDNPLIGLDPEKTVRSDISPLELATQEMEKDAVLGRVFRWRLIIPSKEPRIFKIHILHNLDLWEAHIQKQTSSRNRNLEMVQESVGLFNGQKTRNVMWLRISKIGLNCPSPNLDYAIAIDQENGHAQGYGIFNPNKEADSIDDVASHNALLAQSYRSIYQRRENGNWLRQVHNKMKIMDKQASYKRS